MKKITVLILIVAILFTFAGCKKNSGALYDYNLDEYVTLPDYKNLSVDTKSDDYISGIAFSNYNNLTNAEQTIESEEITSGKVQALDTANIDYTGKKDGVAFEGGTAQGQDLVIGSSSFIDGFETGLIGVEIGQTVDLNLTFPENYQSAELAGAKVVFTVKVNSIKRPKMPEITNELASKLGYDSAEKYNEALKNDYISNYAWKYVMSNSKAIKYPEKELDKFVEDGMAYAEDQATTGGNTLEESLKANGLTVDEYKERLKEYGKNTVLQEMVISAIAQKEKIEVAETEFNEYISANYSGQTLTDDNKESIKLSLLQTKVVDYLTGLVKVS